jgi:phospholipid/cholesterol/gamma-HCH transport system substrate-binding protein
LYIERRVKVQLGVFGVIAVAAAAVMAFGYANLPTVWFGVGRYTVTLQLPQAAGLYPRANVTYRGTEVGEVEDVTLTDTEVTALLSLDSNVVIPSDVDAEVHSVSAIGEQYVALLPRRADASPLRNGDVIPLDRTSVPPDINTLLDATNRGLEAIPQDNLRTAVDEAYTAVGGLGPEIARLIQASTTLARDGRTNLDAVTSLVDQAAPVLNSQTDTAESIRQWAAQIADLTGQLQSSDSAVSDLLRTGGPAADQATQLIHRLRPTLPILLANLISVGQVALDYHAGLEQILVLVPGGPAGAAAGFLPNDTMPKPYKGQYLNLNLNLNLPPPCTTGFLPASQRRAPSLVDSPPRPEGDLYCRVPVDSPFFVRGARNIPCATVPGKRAPTAAMCESDEQFVPLNDGTNWKGDPNATLSGQDVPQFPPQSAPDSAGQAAAIPAAPPEPIAAAQYDPATGAYIGPDGKAYVQSDLARSASPQTWQSMLTPPTG